MDSKRIPLSTSNKEWDMMRTIVYIMAYSIFTRPNITHFEEKNSRPDV